MPYWKISKDIKIAAMRLYKDNILSKPTILDYLSISLRTFDCILALWNATREVVREMNGVRGHPRILHFSDIEYLKHLIRHCPDWFLDEQARCLHPRLLHHPVPLLYPCDLFQPLPLPHLCHSFLPLLSS